MIKVKEESEKVGLKLNILKMKILASGPITSGEIDGETMSDRCSPRGNPACRGTFGGRRKAVRDRLALQGGTGDFP